MFSRNNIAPALATIPPSTAATCVAANRAETTSPTFRNAFLRKARHRTAAGFSMVELVLSLGVLAFAFVSLLALLPAGMSTFRKAVDASVTSQISQRIVNEIQESDFSTYLKKYANAQQTPRYFDDQGNELPDKTNALYWVNVKLATSPTLPGATVSNENLATVTVQIANNPGNKELTPSVDDLWPSTNGVSLTAFTTVIAGNYIAATN